MLDSDASVKVSTQLHAEPVPRRVLHSSLICVVLHYLSPAMQILFRHNYSMVQLENAGTTQLIFFFEHCFRAYGGMGWFTESNLLTTSYGKQLQYIIKHICNTFCQFSGCVRACVRACGCMYA